MPRQTHATHLLALIAEVALAIAMDRLNLARPMASFLGAIRQPLGASLLHNCHRLVREQLQLDETLLASANFTAPAAIAFCRVRPTVGQQLALGKAGVAVVNGFATDDVIGGGQRVEAVHAEEQQKCGNFCGHLWEI